MSSPAACSTPAATTATPRPRRPPRAAASLPSSAWCDVRRRAAICCEIVAAVRHVGQSLCSTVHEHCAGVPSARPSAAAGSSTVALCAPAASSFCDVVAGTAGPAGVAWSRACACVACAPSRAAALCLTRRSWRTPCSRTSAAFESQPRRTASPASRDAAAAPAGAAGGTRPCACACAACAPCCVAVRCRTRRAARVVCSSAPPTFESRRWRSACASRHSALRRRCARTTSARTNLMYVSTNCPAQLPSCQLGPSGM